MAPASELNLKMGRATRDAYGDALAEAGATHPELVVLDADLAKSTKAWTFGSKFRDRFINCGIAEANMVGIASGLAACGKTVFASSFASFLICKSYDQMRMGIAYSNLPVKLVGSHGGITLGEDGASQMAVEDIALTTSLPGFTVLMPADEVSTLALTKELVTHPHPAFMRTGRAKTWIIHKPETKFAIGKAVVLREGGDVAIVACGIMVAQALFAAEQLATEGIEATVVDMHTIKPLDEETLAAVAKRCGAVVVAEEHQVWGGLGAAVAQALGRLCPVPFEHVGIRDTYAKSGTPESIIEKYGLTPREVAAAARTAVSRKKK